MIYNILTINVVSAVLNTYTVNLLFTSSQTTLSSFQKPEFSVPRQHEDFIWLHDTIVETEDYAGLIVSLKPISILSRFMNTHNQQQKATFGQHANYGLY